MQVLGLKRDDVIVPAFAVIVTVATRKHDYFNFVFFSCGANSTTVMTGLMLTLRRIKDRKFYISNWLLNSQSQGVDHGSSCA